MREGFSSDILPSNSLLVPSSSDNPDPLILSSQKRSFDSLQDDGIDINIPTTDVDAMIYLLSRLSYDYLSQAHSMIHKTFNNPQKLVEYRKLIYASIKCLTTIITKLNNIPIITEISIYLKLAQIYYQETNDLKKSEIYLNKAITISRRSNSIFLQFQSEFLTAIIICNNNFKIALKYLNLKINEFKNLNYVSWVKIFEFLKINLLLTIDLKTALTNLKIFNSANNLNSGLHQFSLLMEANLKLYQGSPLDSLNILKICEKINSNSNTQSPPQLKAMLLLNQLKCYMQLNEFKKCSEKIIEMNKFIEFEIKNDLRNWPTEGSFNLNIPLPIDTVNNNKLYPFKVSWLSIEEVQILLWLFNGIFYLYHYSFKDKSIKYLNTSLELLDKFVDKISKKGMSRRGKNPLDLINNDILINFNSLTNKLIKLKLSF